MLVRPIHAVVEGYLVIRACAMAFASELTDTKAYPPYPVEAQAVLHVVYVAKLDPLNTIMPYKYT